MGKKILIVISLVALLWAGNVTWAQEPQVPPEAEEVCRKLLAMLDEGQFKESFVLAAEMVKETPVLWQSHMKSWRGRLGRIENRRLARVEKISYFADLPRGDYLKVVYESNFSAQPQAEEIVVLARNKDGAFAVAGYETHFNRWPEAIRIIYRGLIVVFFIMSLLAVITYGVGRLIQTTEKKGKAMKNQAKG